MQKKRELYFLRSRKLAPFLLKMRITLLLLLACIQGFAGVSAQTRFTLSLKDVSLEDVLKTVERQGNYTFLYSISDVDPVRGLNIDFKDADLKEVMAACLMNTGLIYELNKELVIIKRADYLPQVQQKMLIQGVVRDKKGATLPGVSILLKGTTLGVVTDMEGHFQFEIPQQKEVVLVFSFVGMKKLEFPYKNEKELLIVMEEDVAEIGEVVITGIFTKARESYTGAVTTITAKDLQRVGNRNILSSIRNIDPSFNIVEDINIGSDPNRMPDITVRGSASMTSNVKDLQTDTKSNPNLPLFIMDGFEISQIRMMDLDENQVESITLLKDASATAMYGTRGANGVVVITTKKPEPGKLRITYKGDLNIEAPDLSSYNLMNAAEKLQYEKDAGLYEAYYPGTEEGMKDLYNQRLKEVLRGVDTYWLKYPVRTGIGHRHSLRLEGGGDEFRYAASVAYNNVKGVMKGSERNTFNGNVYLLYKYGNFTFQNDLQVSSNNSSDSPYGTFSDYGRINSYQTPYDDNGNVKKELESDQYYASVVGGKNFVTVYNPLYDALLPSKKEKRYRQIQNNFGLEWTILPELTVRGRLGVVWQTNSSDDYISAKHTSFDQYVEDDYGRRGSYGYGTGEMVNYEADFTLNYSKVFADKHQIYIGAGYNFAQEKNYNYEFRTEGISNINMDFLGMAGGYEKDGRPYATEGIARRIGGVLNANYTYDRRYFVDISGKLDGSSKFGNDNRFAPFWSTGIGWNIHNESFFKEDGIVNMARLRLSYGVSGAQAFNPYQAMTTFKDYGGLNYNGWNAVYLMAIGNPYLGWQKTKQLNMGLELELFRGRIRLNADWYNKMTDDLLTDITLPASGGFDTYKANVGKILNRGVEVGLNAYLIRNTERGIVWSIGGSLAQNRNEVKAISNSLDFLNQELLNEGAVNPSFLFKEGQSMKTIFAVRSLGIDPSNGKEIFLKQDGTRSYVWDAKDKVPCGVAEPKIWGNLNTMLRYKGFTFNAVFSYRYGGQMYNSTLVEKVENTYPYENADRRAYYDRWDTKGVSALYKSKRDFSTTNASSRFVMDENTLECRSLSLAYDCEADWVKRFGVSYLTVSGYTEDVFRISTIRQERGLTYPFARKYSLSLMLRF